MTRRQTIKTLKYIRQYRLYGMGLSAAAYGLRGLRLTRRQWARIKWRKQSRFIMDFNPNNTRRVWTKEYLSNGA